MQALLAEPRTELDEDTVRSALTHGGAPKVRHGVDVLDTSDDPTDEQLPFEEGNVTWSYRPPDRVTGETTEAAEVRRQATLTVLGDVTLPLVARRFRIWTELLAPSNVWVRFWLGVFAATLPPLEDDGTVLRRRLVLADKSRRWADVTLGAPVTVAAAANPVDEVKTSLTTKFGETAFSIPPTDVVLDEAMFFDGSTTYLAFYNALLEKAGYDQVSPDHAGRPASRPLSGLTSRFPEVHYGPGQRKILTASSIESLVPSLPNVVRFIARSGPSLAEEGNGIRTVRNLSTGSASIASRGEEVVLEVTVDAEGQAELDAIAYADAQRYFAGGGLRFTGQVALNPLHGDRDLMRLTKPRLGVAGEDFNVTQWTYPLKKFKGTDAVLMPIVAERQVLLSTVEV